MAGADEPLPAPRGVVCLAQADLVFASDRDIALALETQFARQSAGERFRAAAKARGFEVRR